MDENYLLTFARENFLSDIEKGHIDGRYANIQIGIINDTTPVISIGAGKTEFHCYPDITECIDFEHDLDLFSQFKLPAEAPFETEKKGVVPTQYLTERIIAPERHEILVDTDLNGIRLKSTFGYKMGQVDKSRIIKRNRELVDLLESQYADNELIFFPIPLR